MIEWDDKLSVDNGWIDADHLYLIKIINQFEKDYGQSARVETLVNILQSLKAYANVHFRREEKFQRRIQYPYHASHCEEHNELVKMLGELIGEIETASADRVKDLAIETTNLLSTWLIDHIMSSDMKMAVYIRSARERGVALDLSLSE